MAAAAELVDDVIPEILLRLPPDEPRHLFRAALVCRSWLHHICDPDFRRRYRVLHGVPPLLGILHRLRSFQGDPPARFASTTSVPEFPHPGSDGRRTRPLDCRHGRVLIHMLQGEGSYYLVWDPVTGDRHYVPTEPDDIQWLGYSAAVLCASPDCDHLDCRGCPFRIVFAATHEHKSAVLTSVYSSEAGVRSVPICLDNTCESYAQHMLQAGPDYTPFVQPRRGTLVGDALYFTLRRGNAIVKYDLGNDRLSMIDSPNPDVYFFSLMAMEDNISLGFAYIQGSCLYIWSRMMDTEEEKAAEWVQYRVIELEEIIPIAHPNDKPFVVGFGEGVGVIFVSSSVGLFTIKLSSGQVERIDEPGGYYSVLPYMSFYLPRAGNGGGHDAADLPHNT